MTVRLVVGTLELSDFVGLKMRSFSSSNKSKVNLMRAKRPLDRRCRWIIGRSFTSKSADGFADDEVTVRCGASGTGGDHHLPVGGGVVRDPRPRRRHGLRPEGPGTEEEVSRTSMEKRQRNGHLPGPSWLHKVSIVLVGIIFYRHFSTRQVCRRVGKQGRSIE